MVKFNAMKLLLLLLLSFKCFTIMSQNSITVNAHETNVNFDCCQTLLGDIGTEITVTNISNNSLEIKVSRELITGNPESINYFCWNSCYGSHVSVSPGFKIFSPQQVDENSFQVHFDNMGIVPSSASIRYCAFDHNNPSDSACTIVNYSVSTSSITDKSLENFFSDFHPNPSISTAIIEYKLNYSDVAEIVLTDMLGNVVRKENNIKNSGNLKFDISDTEAGLYFANITVNGEFKTIKRLVVGK